MSLLLHRLNYQHLFYFWLSVREGSATAAAKKLRLSQSTVSAQIAMLQDSLGEKLFARAGRGAPLTDAGRAVLRYADEVFPHGERLLEDLGGVAPSRTRRLTVGVADGVAKLSARLALRPVFDLPEPPVVTCVQDDVGALGQRLQTYELDVLLADEPLSAPLDVPGVSFLLHEGDTSFFALPTVASALEGEFPASLSAAPLLLPGARSAMRKAMVQWFDRLGVRPRVVAEVEDSALLKAMAQDGLGVFAAPTVVAEDIVRSYGVVVLGRASALRSCLYAHTITRRHAHPAVAALVGSRAAASCTDW